MRKIRQSLFTKKVDAAGNNVGGSFFCEKDNTSLFVYVNSVVAH